MVAGNIIDRILPVSFNESTVQLAMMKIKEVSGVNIKLENLFSVLERKIFGNNSSF
jgi:hypothetical protein